MERLAASTLGSASANLPRYRRATPGQRTAGKGHSWWLSGIVLTILSISAPAAKLDTTGAGLPDSVSFAALELQVSRTAETSAERPLGDRDVILSADIDQFAPQAPAVTPRLNAEPLIGLSAVNDQPLPLAGAGLPLGEGPATADGMSLMVLVWLFGVGLIGMGTVGRRKQL